MKMHTLIVVLVGSWLAGVSCQADDTEKQEGVKKEL